MQDVSLKPTAPGGMFFNPQYRHEQEKVLEMGLT